MLSNDVDTSKMFCPICGFNPPCGRCMWSLENDDGKVACSIAVEAETLSGNHVKNVAEPFKEGE